MSMAKKQYQKVKEPVRIRFKECKIQVTHKSFSIAAAGRPILVSAEDRMRRFS